jgi:hypothetical protein
MSAILVSEPRFQDYHHAQFNLAFLEMLYYASDSKDGDILFCSAQSYQKVMREHATFYEKKTFWTDFQMDFPKTKSSLLRNPFIEYFILRQICKLTEQKAVESIFLTSCNPFLIMVAIVLYLLGFIKAHVYFVIHGELDKYIKNPVSRFWWANLQHFTPNKFKYILLCPCILEELQKEYKDFNSKHIIAIEIPYCSPPIEKLATTYQQRHIINLGYIGNIAEYKSQADLSKISDTLKQNPKYQITFTKAFGENRYVPIETMAKIIQDMDFFLFVGSSRYRFSASGSILDGITFGIPGFFLASPLVHYYTKKFGEIGLVFDTKDELINFLMTIETTFILSKRTKIVKNIINIQNQFSPKQIASQFRNHLVKH